MLGKGIDFRILDCELRSAITIFLGVGEILKNQQLTLEQQFYVEHILKSAKRLLSLANLLSTIQKTNRLEQENRPRVLIVDDYELILLVHKNSLMQLGCVIDTAITGEEALTLTEQTFYDLIFLDLDLPKMSGIEVSQEINKRFNIENRPRVIGITSYIDESIKEECLEAGMEDVILKPVRLETFKQIICPSFV